jgi:hypothetical protein
MAVAADKNVPGGLLLAKYKLMKWEPVTLNYIHTQTCTGLELMTDQVSVLNILLSQL